MTARGLLVVLGIVACGDNTLHDNVFTAASGSRIALQLYRYDDGTEQTEPNEMYDKDQHTLCTAQRWIDGIVRKRNGELVDFDVPAAMQAAQVAVAGLSERIGKPVV